MGASESSPVVEPVPQSRSRSLTNPTIITNSTNYHNHQLQQQQQLQSQQLQQSHQNSINHHNESVEFAANSLTIQPEKSMYKIQKQVDFIKHGYNDAYGKFKVMQFRSTKHQFAFVEGFTSQQAEFKVVSKEVERRLRFSHNSLVPITSAFQSQRKEYCGESFTIHICLDYIPLTLEDQINARRAQKTHCSEREIITMINCVLSALIYLRDIVSTVHEWIQPKTILYDQHTKTYRITDVRFLSRGANEFILLFNGINDTNGNSANNNPNECYLSPELLNALGHRQLDPVHSIEKSTLFSLGLSALRMATLSSLNGIYDFQTHSIVAEQLENYLQRAETIYSPRLTSLLRAMLHLDLQQRPDYDRLESYLTEVNNSYQNKIIVSSATPVRDHSSSAKTIKPPTIPSSKHSITSPIPPQQRSIITAQLDHSQNGQVIQQLGQSPHRGREPIYLVKNQEHSSSSNNNTPTYIPSNIQTPKHITATPPRINPHQVYQNSPMRQQQSLAPNVPAGVIYSSSSSSIRPPQLQHAPPSFKDQSPSRQPSYPSSARSRSNNNEFEMQPQSSQQNILRTPDNTNPYQNTVQPPLHRNHSSNKSENITFSTQRAPSLQSHPQSGSTVINNSTIHQQKVQSNKPIIPNPVSQSQAPRPLPPIPPELAQPSLVQSAQHQPLQQVQQQQAQPQLQQQLMEQQQQQLQQSQSQQPQLHQQPMSSAPIPQQQQQQSHFIKPQYYQKQPQIPRQDTHSSQSQQSIPQAQIYPSHLMSFQGNSSTHQSSQELSSLVPPAQLQGVSPPVPTQKPSQRYTSTENLRSLHPEAKKMSPPRVANQQSQLLQNANLIRTPEIRYSPARNALLIQKQVPPPPPQPTVILVKDSGKKPPSAQKYPPHLPRPTSNNSNLSSSRIPQSDINHNPFSLSSRPTHEENQFSNRSIVGTHIVPPIIDNSVRVSPFEHNVSIQNHQFAFPSQQQFIQPWQQNTSIITDQTRDKNKYIINNTPSKYSVEDFQIKPPVRYQQTTEIQSRLEQLSARIDKFDLSLKDSSEKNHQQSSSMATNQQIIQTSHFTPQIAAESKVQQ